MPTKKSSRSKKVTTKTKSVKKAAPKKKSPPSVDDRLTKEALKLVDKASDFLRASIKNSSKTTTAARGSFHKEAHVLLGKASRNLEDLLESGTKALRKAIDKI